MRCTDPRTVGFRADGKTISWSQKNFSKEYATFQLPCGQCLECRLEYARQWAVRCVHEAQIHEKNAFITLTYDEKNLRSPKLDYVDFQLFAKRLRSKIYRDFVAKYGKENWKLLTPAERKNALKDSEISIFVTGEYGDKTKRPHWHACIFNWSPDDGIHLRTNDLGDRIYSSDSLTQLWGKGLAEYGSVTFRSAGYCARYAAKKLVHGYDKEHEFHPISKKSSKHAIGKRWLEKFWPDVFNYGEVILPDGSSCSIPRYYEKWFKDKHPKEYLRYVTTIKAAKCDGAQRKADKEKADHANARAARSERTLLDQAFRESPTTRVQAARAILRAKFKELQEHLKL